MRIETIKLENYRNYESLELELDPGTNLFYGDNAQGKTNILESVYLCGTTKSHRGSKDREMIRFGQEEAHIRMETVRKEIPCRVDMHLKKNRAKGIAVNGVPIHKASELIGLGNFVFFSPEDLNIIKNGPSERRRFLDMELCQLSRVYVHNLINYNRVLMQRNRLLKDISFHPEYRDTLDIWDEQMASYGISLIRSRDDFIRELNGIIFPIHERLSGGREELTLLYEKNVSEQDFREQLAGSREKDIRMRVTHIGPHRDEILFQIGGVDIRRFGSQGQQRTAALSLKLAEIDLVREKSKDTPVLLLDDVLSELDANRQRYLLESISRIQTLLTGTGIEEFVENRFPIHRLFYVEAGKVTRQK